MTAGQIAGLIAAIAFVVLVCFIGMFLSRLGKTLEETTKSIEGLSKDVDALTHELENVLGNTNELLEDLNKKSTELDPAVKAIADLGQSASDVNAAARQFTDRLNAQHESAKQSRHLLAADGKKAALNVLSKLHRSKED